jgi:diguanylate cyclase (GGDEF)-like protein
MTEQQTQKSVLLSDEELTFSQNAQKALQTQLKQVLDVVRSQTPSNWVPQEISDALRSLSRLSGCIVRQSREGNTLPCVIQIEDLPVLRLAIELHVEEKVLQQEQTASLTHSQEPQVTLQKQLDTGLTFLRSSLFSGVEPTLAFSLDRYLNLETVMRFRGASASLEPRVFDDKFHILMSQSLFMKDLRYFREQCLMRKRPVSVAYLDIDKFKDLNTRLTETQVDKEVLPRFMSALEAFVFGRGYAYREGGDEYLVILPGASHTEAARFFDSLRVHLATVSYPILGTDAGPTVSIGVCTAETSERLTAFQIQQFANSAKAYAKTEGRNRVAGYVAGQPRTNEALTILGESSAVAPASESEKPR